VGGVELWLDKGTVLVDEIVFAVEHTDPVYRRVIEGEVVVG
jgi:hypothetical protein